MKSKSATGVSGHLLDNFDGTYCFRVYDVDGTFKDYDLHHCDLMVTIVDEDAAFYERDYGEMILDHAPATLGKEDDND